MLATCPELVAAWYHSERGELRGFKWSSQRSMEGGCDGQAKGLGGGLCGATPDALAGSATSGAAGASGAVLGRDRARRLSELAAAAPACRSPWRAVVPRGGGMPSVVAPVSGRYLSFAEREEIALVEPTSAASARSRASSSLAVDDLAGTAA